MFTYCSTSLRRKILFLVILSLVVGIFQLLYVQNKLINQRKDTRTYEHFVDMMSRYFSTETDGLKTRTLSDQSIKGFEIELVDNYVIGERNYSLKDTVDTPVNFKAETDKSKLNYGRISYYIASNTKQPLIQRTKVKNEKLDRDAELNRSPSTQKTLMNAKTSHFGFLNLHIWDNICGDQVQSLKEFILFPGMPKLRTLIRNFEVKGKNRKDIGLRIFGFLRPNESGSYKFRISSRGNSELWLSNDEKPRKTKLIAFIGTAKEQHKDNVQNTMKFPSQISDSISLEKDRQYFIEVLYKHESGSHGVEVAWLKPGTLDFRVISSKFLCFVVNDTYIANDTVSVEEYNEKRRHVDSQRLKHISFMKFVDFEGAFPECEYEPSYYVQKKLVRFQGARNQSNTHFAEVSPPDSTNETLPLVINDDSWWIENSYGNAVIDNKTVVHVWDMFTRNMEDKYNGTFKVAKLVSIERAIDKAKGSRYHVQVEVEDVYSGRHFHFSEFLYQPRGAGYLCFPRGFRWNKQATVNVIVPVKDSGRWAMYLIKNIAEIVYETRDPLVNVIIIDYESTDINITAVLKKSSLTRYTVVQLPGNNKFNRAQALQKGADAVKDPHSILFFCDLNLKIPTNLIETVRKHCVEGKMAFAPVVKRLKCGFYPKSPFGYWETLGFGLFALFKSDFDRIGGMNVKEFQKWGGEDWELLDRVLESQIEVERLKIPSFYHFYHPPFGSDYSRINA